MYLNSFLGRTNARLIHFERVDDNTLINETKHAKTGCYTFRRRLKSSVKKPRRVRRACRVYVEEPSFCTNARVAFAVTAL